MQGKILDLSDFKNLIEKDKYVVYEHVYFMNAIPIKKIKEISKKGRFECKIIQTVIFEKEFKDYYCLSTRQEIPEVQKSQIFN